MTTSPAHADRDVDVVILGAGTAGLTARRAAEAEGASALLLDPGPWGTTCARVGCMPSKLLIAAAEAAHSAREADGFGVHAGPVRVDGAAVMARVRSERDRFAGFVVEDSDALAAADKLWRSRGQLLAPGLVRASGVDGRERLVRAKAVVIATGSAPFVPPPLRGAPQLTDNEGVFSWSDLPRSVLVVGAGVIGLELGQALHRLGVRTTIVGLGGGLAGIDDARVRDAAAAILRAELDVQLDAPIEAIASDDAGRAVVTFRGDDGIHRSETYDCVVVAAGRRPMLDGLGLASAGVTLDGRGRPLELDPLTLQLGDAPIFLAGDVNDLHPLLHEAADDGRIAGANAARLARAASGLPAPPVEAGMRRTPMGVVFTDPNIGWVGARASALDRGRVCIAEVSYANQGRARVMRQHRGLLRLWAERGSGVLLGAEFVGPRMEHIAHLLAWTVQQRLTVAQALDMPFYHPVIEEGLRTALQHLAKALRVGRPLGEPCEATLPGA